MKAIASTLLALSVLAGVAKQANAQTHGYCGAPGQQTIDHLGSGPATKPIWIAHLEPTPDMTAPTPGPTDPNGPPV
jgi:hypothetical protein